jgi:hypothetical protein
VAVAAVVLLVVLAGQAAVVLVRVQVPRLLTVQLTEVAAVAAVVPLAVVEAERVAPGAQVL